jgi:hypothetical protein
MSGAAMLEAQRRRLLRFHLSVFCLATLLGAQAFDAETEENCGHRPAYFLNTSEKRLIQIPYLSSRM